MSVSEFPSEDSESRQERAEDTQILEVREIDGSAFDIPSDATVYEVDLINEAGEKRENVTIIPRILFENTKDVQHRHNDGIVGKYSRALALESSEAKQQLIDGIEDKRESVQEQIADLRAKDSRLFHTRADIDSVDWNTGHFSE